MHHLIEKRFANIMGQAPKDMKSIAIPKAVHQEFTNAWRSAIPYKTGTQNATQEQVELTAKEIYKEYPEILKSLGL